MPLLVAVTTRNGDFVPGLTAADFEVFDDGRRAEVVAFAERAVPVAVRLVAANTPRMRGSKDRARAVALSLIEQALKSEPVGINFLGSSGTGSGAFIDDKALLRAEFDRIFQPVGIEGTSAWTALRTASDLLLRPVDSLTGWLPYSASKQPSQSPVWESGQLPSVRALIVLSQGIDDMNRPWSEREGMSRERFEELHSPESISQRVVTSGTIVIGLGFNGIGKDKHLARLSNDSSGRYVEVTGRTRPNELATEIWRDLRNRYLLGFFPTSFDGKAHTLSVKVKRPDLAVRVRDAYVAPKSPS